MSADLTVPKLSLPLRLAASAADSCACLQAQSFQATNSSQRPWTPLEFSTCLEDETHLGLGVFVETNHQGADALPTQTLPLAAFGLLRFIVDEAELLMLATAPQFWRLGLARRILKALITACQNKSLTSLFLEVAVDNEPALALYAQMGFREIGRRPDYYPDDAIANNTGRKTAIVMARQL